jgi:triosephosphate isomerase (TIM)
MIIINFKNYVAGAESVKLAQTIQKYLPRAVVAVPATDIWSVVSKTKLPVYAQHISSFEKGLATGFVGGDAVKKVGAKGTLLNHSEHPISWRQLERTITHAKKLGLKTVVCAPSVRAAGQIARLKPHAIAFEDAKLISTNRSITMYRAQAVKDFARIVGHSDSIPICGAGIHTAADVAAAKQLGCKGVLIASAVAHVRDPRAFLEALAKL